MMTLGEVLTQAQHRLAMAGVDDPRRDARLIIGALLDISQATMVGFPETAISKDHLDVIDAAIARRVKREPVSRILGEREFFGLPFRLGPETLDPRPDSETIVEAGIACLRKVCNGRVLDLGTGTGCLLLSILSEVKDATGLGMDVSDNAIETARLNANYLDLQDRARFVRESWLADSWRTLIGDGYHLVVANPPYIPDQDIDGLSPEVRNFDPLRALAGGHDGLDPYRHLIPHVPQLLQPKGWAVFEVGIGQAEDVATLFRDAGMIVTGMPKDLGGISRCVVAHKE